MTVRNGHPVSRETIAGVTDFTGHVNGRRSGHDWTASWVAAGGEGPSGSSVQRVARAAARTHTELAGPGGDARRSRRPLRWHDRPGFQSVPAQSITGAADEIQRNIIARTGPWTTQGTQAGSTVSFRDEAREHGDKHGAWHPYLGASPIRYSFVSSSSRDFRSLSSTNSAASKLAASWSGLLAPHNRSGDRLIRRDPRNGECHKAHADFVGNGEQLIDGVELSVMPITALIHRTGVAERETTPLCRRLIATRCFPDKRPPAMGLSGMTPTPSSPQNGSSSALYLAKQQVVAGLHRVEPGEPERLAAPDSADQLITSGKFEHPVYRTFP